MIQFAQKKSIDNEQLQRCQIDANFARIELNPQKCSKVYHYTIEISMVDKVQNKDDKNVNQRNRLRQQKKIVSSSNLQIFQQIVDANRNIFGNIDPVFDCRQNVYSVQPLIFEGNKHEITDIRFKPYQKRFAQNFTCVINKPTDNVLDLSRLNSRNPTNFEREVQALDIIINYGSLQFNLVLNSKSFRRFRDLQAMDARQRSAISFSLGNFKEGRFGSYCSARLTEIGVQLNIDRAACVFHKGGRLLDLIREFLQENQGGNQRGDYGANQRGGRGGGRGRGDFNQRGGRGQGRGNFGNQGDRYQQRNDGDQVDNSGSLRLDPGQKNQISDELRGLEFNCLHQQGRQTYIFYQLSDKKVSDITFDFNGEQTSVLNYYSNTLTEKLAQIGIAKLDPNLPCVQVGKTTGSRPQNVAYYPIEVVNICGDQYYRNKLSPKQQPTMTRICGQQHPTDRFRESLNQIQTLINNSRNSRTDYLSAFGVSISANFTKVNSYLLKPPCLEGGKSFSPRDARWNIDDAKGFFKPADIVNQSNDFSWIVVNFNSERGRNLNWAPARGQVDALVNTTIRLANKNGLKLPRPIASINESFGGRGDVKSVFEGIKQDYPGLKFALFVIPKNDDLYHQIKYESEVVKTNENNSHDVLVTQCVSFEKKNQFEKDSYVSNVLLKINPKLGGTNVRIERSSRVGYFKNKTMICGLDVTHPSRLDRLGNSIASAVASYDANCVNYFSKSVIQQRGHTEIIRLDSIFKEFLTRFKSKNSFYPKNILVYRDGVSEGEYSQVIENEIVSIRKSFEGLPKDETDPAGCNPKITYIICQKRHNIRLLPCNSKDALVKGGNVKPGVVVNTKIVSNLFEFVLCSHNGPLGCSRPTRYTVLHDEGGFSAEDIFTTTYHCTYLFPRSTLAVSVVAPVLYAHLCAARTRQFLAAMKQTTYGENGLDDNQVADLNRTLRTHEELNNRLFFL